MSDYLRNMINNQSITPPATLIKGATLLSMDDRVGNLERGDILIEGAKIVAISENLAAEGARLIDATHMIAMPGLVDTHRHAWEGQLQRHALLVRQVLSPCRYLYRQPAHRPGVY